MIAVLLAACALIRPWGDYPLNDDWFYARYTKTLVETGRFVMDPSSTPNVFGQVIAAFPVVRVLGFSHTVLRGFTIAVSCFVLWLLDGILRVVGVGRGLRLAALLLIALNPLYLYSSLSFMTEIHGAWPMWAGVWVWLAERQRMSRYNAGPLVRPGFAMLAGALIGWGFWTRQYVVLTLPALVGATLWIARTAPEAHRGGDRLRASTMSFCAAFLALIALIVGHHLWAKATGTFPRTSLDLLSLVLHPSLDAWMVHIPACIFYMTAFCAPLLVAISWKGLPRRRALLVCAGLWCVYLVLKFLVHDGNRLNPTFPFLGNIIHDTGLGPLNLPPPDHGARWPAWRWNLIEGAIALLLAGWTPVLMGARTLGREGRLSTPARELLLFSALLAGLTLAAQLLTARERIFDRYHLTIFTVLALALVVYLQESLRHVPVWAWPWRYALLLAPIAWFALAGAHDQFRWQDARWALTHRFLDAGGSPRNLLGGYEINGWLAFDDWASQRVPGNCLGPCGCHVQTFFCIDDSYRIARQALPGYRIADSIKVDGWLARQPPVVLLERRAGP